MEQERIQELINKYNEGLCDPKEILLVEQLIEEGKIELSQLRELTALDDKLMKMQSPVPSMEMDDQFYKMLSSMKKSKSGFSWSTFFSWPEVAPKLAFASLTLIVGFLPWDRRYERGARGDLRGLAGNDRRRRGGYRRRRTGRVP
jgi:hypothetical protein